ncbi:MAG: hypothetical protein GY772_14260, partial [bacterium]|nr:hypothetical protein [bacterium]
RFDGSAARTGSQRPDASADPPPATAASGAPPLTIPAGLPARVLPPPGTPLGDGRRYLVMRPASHVDGSCTGLYNRFPDYQRVVSEAGSRLGYGAVSDPASNSVRVESIEEAEEIWLRSGSELPVPRRCH